MLIGYFNLMPLDELRGLEQQAKTLIGLILQTFQTWVKMKKRLDKMSLSVSML